MIFKEKNSVLFLGILLLWFTLAASSNETLAAGSNVTLAASRKSCGMEIKCSNLCKYLEFRVGDVTRNECDEKSCTESKMIQSILQDSEKYLNLSIYDADHIIIDQFLTRETLEKFIVHAFIGRFFVSQNDKPNDDQNDEQKFYFLNYNFATNAFAFNLPNCTFQKNLYDTLLIITIAILLCSLLLNNWKLASVSSATEHGSMSTDADIEPSDPELFKSGPAGIQSAATNVHAAVRLRLHGFKGNVKI